MKSIRFIDFWKTSEGVQTRFFKPLFEQVYGEKVEIISESKKRVDLEIYSVFPPKRGILTKALTHYGVLNPREVDWFTINPRPNAERKIWFTGENIHPPLHLDFDAFLSFDSQMVDARNIYMPLWVLNLDWFGIKDAHGFAGLNPTLTELLSPRSIDEESLLQRKFCVSFIGNPENTRLSAVNFLSTKGQVDLFGRINGTHVKNKIDVGSGYKFILAFENTPVSGYVTEKLLEAHLTGAIPIYWGLDVHEYFNENAYIDFNKFENLGDLADYVGKVGNDGEIMQNFLSQPIMKRPFPMSEIVNKLRHVLYV